MTDEVDRNWLDTLAGRSPSRGSDREAEGLRRQLLERSGVAGPTVAERDPDREEALLARAREAGLLPSRGRSWSFWRSGPALAVAGLAGVALLAVLFLRQPDAPPTVRSDPGGVVRLTAADPTAAAQRIVHDLRAVGVEATAYERLGRRGIDADLPQPLPHAVRSVLRRHGIPEPADGVLKLEIEETARP